jgi:O-acetylhomoserine/O-acetylserine sulfhydrylase-like pyridoxal-dependent enzyme
MEYRRWRRALESRRFDPRRAGYLPDGISPLSLSAPRMRIETLAVRAGHAVDPSTGAVTPPIHLSTTFEREPDGSDRQGFLYSRMSNPGRQSLETALAALEGGTAAIAFASGMAATHAVFQSLAPGDHVLLQGDAYYSTLRLAREIFGTWGLESSACDMSDLSDVKRLLRPTTKVVWVETPSNPLLHVVDRWIGGAIAPVAGSGSAPAWTASVSNFSSRSCIGRTPRAQRRWFVRCRRQCAPRT